MKELAKSALSLGCALSLLSAKQAYSVVADGQSAAPNVLGPVTEVAVGQLDESMKRIHRAADSMESQAIEMAFSLINPARWPSPTTWNPWSSATRSEDSSTSAPAEPQTVSSRVSNSDHTAPGSDSSGIDSVSAD